jgi:predicted acetyltransferase
MKLPWRKPKIYEGARVDLREERKVTDREAGYKSICYGIYLHGRRTRIGECDIRLGNEGNEELYYAGEAGYRIGSGWRGHHYAYDACRIMMRIFRMEHHRHTMILTCSPDNIPSRCIIERLGGQFLEETDVPAWHWLYKRGEKQKRIYRVSL